MVNRAQRVLFLLLVTRVVAAPIALHPSPVDHPSELRMVVRVCAWPAPTAGAASTGLTQGQICGVETWLHSPRSRHLAVPTPLPSCGLFPTDGYTRRSIARLRC